MSKTLIPAEALNRHIGFLGATGSGKTTAAKVAIVEPALLAGERVIIIDPTAAWWGLRLMRDGKMGGEKIYIFGGDRGDYPLRARDAGLLADAFGAASDSAIFDVSQMTVSERQTFFTEFAQQILRKNRGPLKLIIDEAHLFMPQAGAKVSGQVPAMLHAGNNLVSLGRSKGLRITLISQRPAKLHKDSLSQVQSLVAMRLMAPQDRKAIADWIADQADPQAGKDIIASLPTLKPGEGWVWSPNDNYLERTRFPMPRTFDSSKAPEMGDGTGPDLKPLNLDALKGKLAAVEKERADNDPKALRAEVARLTKELAAKPTAAADEQALDAAHQEGHRLGYIAGRRDVIIAATKLLAETHSRVVSALTEAEMAFKLNSGEGLVPMPAPARALVTASRDRAEKAAAKIFNAGPQPISGNGGISGPQMRVMRAMVMWDSLGHKEPSRAMVAAVAGYSPSSGGFNNLVGRLGAMGVLGTKQKPGHLILLDGRDVPNMSKEEARDMLLGTLSNPQRKLVDALTDMPTPRDGTTRELLGEATGYSPSSGGFNNLIGSLSTLGIIVKPQPGAVALSDWAQELLQ